MVIVNKWRERSSFIGVQLYIPVGGRFNSMLTCLSTLEGFLKAHALVHDLPTLDDLERERQDLRSLGL